MTTAYALTYPQLMNQALALGLDTEFLGRLRAAHWLAEDYADGIYRAQGVPFLCHLTRTASILLAERQPPRVVLAGLLHALPILDRERGALTGNRWGAAARRTAGREVEELMAVYARLPWRRSLAHHLERLDRLGEREREALRIRLANELEDRLDRTPTYVPRLWARRPPDGEWLALAMELADRLGLARVAEELRGLAAQAPAAPVPEVMLCDADRPYSRFGLARNVWVQALGFGRRARGLGRAVRSEA